MQNKVLIVLVDDPFGAESIGRSLTLSFVFAEFVLCGSVLSGRGSHTDFVHCRTVVWCSLPNGGLRFATKS